MADAKKIKTSTLSYDEKIEYLKKKLEKGDITESQFNKAVARIERPLLEVRNLRKTFPIKKTITGANCR